VSRAASLLPLSATYIHHVDLANAVVSTPLEVEYQQQMRRSDSILHTTERDLERVRAAGRAAVASLRARPVHCVAILECSFLYQNLFCFFGICSGYCQA
jgi:hypothetical protein